MKLDFKLAEAYRGTTTELNGVICALKGKYFGPKTVVTYSNGDVVKYEIEGGLGSNSIPDRANVVKVEVGNTITSFGPVLFDNCSLLTSVTIPNSVSSFGIETFYGCSNLTSIIIPNTVNSIGADSFLNCPATVTFEGKTKSDVQTMSGFRWSVGTDKIVCTDGTL